jgi:hypothetical protein
MLYREVDSTGIKAEGESERRARKHGGAKRRLWRKIHTGVDEPTLEIRAIEGACRSVGDAPVLPGRLSQIPLTWRSGRSPLLVPTTRASATTPSPTGAPMPSSRPAGLQGCASHRPQGPSPGTGRCAHQNASAAPSGENGPGITADVAPNRRCIA